ncbi:glycoside hydrolase family 43 protein [uncultured Sphingomonas sp.]|uniref:glycoside hydrolase family 43 protein n=1 Tax=uncultured Sphingomonas sp. TaxID=158754 RepID=UPI0025F99D94|nr:glycoside hydrolase family 43 protein [uncultured Sphingomonas sp.]
MLGAAATASCLAVSVEAANQARFDWFEYQGVQSGVQATGGHYRNPILAGFYPDPSVTKVGSDFYLVNSTFSWFPGIPIWRSRDLVNWRQIGNVIDRPRQLDFARLGMSRGVFAPAIAHHDGTFYVVNTCVDCGGNFVVTARDPKGPWSDPVWIKDVEGIDPSLFFDDDGTAWLVNNRGPAGGDTYPGHRAIWMQRFDANALKTAGEPIQIVNGGVDLAAKPVWIEGPHIFKKDGFYYLTAAEGGTSVNHSQVIFRAETVTGPYMPAPAGVNPILTQRSLDPARPFPITSAGHADLVRLDDGNWWAVFLATRPYEGDLYNTGRETFLLPVTWRDGWPTILPQGRAIPAIAAAPRLPAGPASPVPFTGSFTVREEFDGPRLPLQWMTMRTPRSNDWWRMDHGALVLDARPTRIGDGGQPSLWARRQQHADATISTMVRFAPAEGESAGIAAIQNDNAFLSVALGRKGGLTLVRVARRAGTDAPVDGRTIASARVPAGVPIELRIHARGGRYDFAFAVKPGQWQTLVRDVDGTNLSTSKAGGFVGTMIGLYAQASAGASPRVVKE